MWPMAIDKFFFVECKEFMVLYWSQFVNVCFENIFELYFFSCPFFSRLVMQKPFLMEPLFESFDLQLSRFFKIVYVFITTSYKCTY